MGIKLKLPIKIKADNVGAIYLAKNFSLSQNTKHIDICRHFVPEHIARSEDIQEYILTKNTLDEIFLHNQSIRTIM
jgi:hypothetical protein